MFLAHMNSQLAIYRLILGLQAAILFASDETGLLFAV